MPAPPAPRFRISGSRCSVPAARCSRCATSYREDMRLVKADHRLPVRALSRHLPRRGRRSTTRMRRASRSTTSPTSTRSTTACWRTACGRSSSSASCRRSSRDPPSICMRSGTSPTSRRRRTTRKWDALIDAFARHLVERYGIDEVAQWYFEVWNEPNIDFWAGKPKQATYYELYDHTARALKQVNTRLRVGGPSTAQAAWAGDFIAHCKREQRAGRLRLHARLRQRHARRMSSERRADPARPDGLPRGAQGAR